MNIDRKNAEKPLRKLRKALKQLPSDPSAEQVHSLRTQTRRIEAVVDALPVDEKNNKKKKAHRLLKAVTPVRKAAGDVRDVDVLVSKVLALSTKRHNEALARLVEHLGELRVESARELRNTVAAHRKRARERLKDYSKLLARRFNDDEQVIGSAPAPAELATELTKWPRLDAENIHLFRIRIKHLRCMLQLSSDTDRQLMDALDKVKDEVGDWHDWQELATIARQVLDRKADAGALERIDEIGSRKLKEALAAANAVRKRYFSSEWRGAKRAG